MTDDLETRGPGRPAHEPTAESRGQVLALLSLCWTMTRIAEAIGCSLPTLKKHYSFELKEKETQRDRFFAYRIGRLIEQIEKGNVSAMRVLNQMIEAREAVAPKIGVPLVVSAGKKVAARRDAEALAAGGDGGEWGDDLTPGELRH